MTALTVAIAGAVAYLTLATAATALVYQRGKIRAPLQHSDTPTEGEPCD